MWFLLKNTKKINDTIVKYAYKKYFNNYLERFLDEKCFSLKEDSLVELHNLIKIFPTATRVLPYEKDFTLVTGLTFLFKPVPKYYINDDIYKMVIENLSPLYKEGLLYTGEKIVELIDKNRLIRDKDVRKIYRILPTIPGYTIYPIVMGYKINLFGFHKIKQYFGDEEFLHKEYYHYKFSYTLIRHYKGYQETCNYVKKHLHKVALIQRGKIINYFYRIDDLFIHPTYHLKLLEIVLEKFEMELPTEISDICSPLSPFINILFNILEREFDFRRQEIINFYFSNPHVVDNILFPVAEQMKDIIKKEMDSYKRRKNIA